MNESRPKRTCGNCSLCCRTLAVPEVKKPHEWCPHCKPGKGGCTIYRTRPERCRDWHCQWLIDEKFGDYWKPVHSRIVIDTRVEPQPLVMFIVDPDYPLRWREEPWFSDIKTIARAGIEGRLGKKWSTLVLLKDETLPIIM